MKKNAVICAIEHSLRDECCNEVTVCGLYGTVKKTRGNFDVRMDDFLAVLRDLETDGLFEVFGEQAGLTEDSLIARSQNHPSVPYSKPMQL